MKNKKSLFLFTIGLLLVTLLGFAAVYEKKQQPKEPLSATAFKLNTVVTVNIYDSKDKKLLDETMELCDHYEKLFSRTLSSSEISRTNLKTGKRSFCSLPRNRRAGFKRSLLRRTFQRRF